jgi:DNA integrity scanning protein DisA with diadenylate cyclase activity
MVRRTRRHRIRKTRRNQRGGKPLGPGEIPVGTINAAKGALNKTETRLDKIYKDAYYFAFNKFVKGADIESIISEIKTVYSLRSEIEDDAIRQGVDAAKAEYERLYT